MPTKHSLLYEYHFDVQQNVWVPWSSIVPVYKHDPSMKYNQILVPTIDTTRTTWLLELMIEAHKPTVLVGETGTSKTATIQVGFLFVLKKIDLIKV